MSTPIAIVKSLDHLVLTCASVPATITWYTRHLGMRHETFTPPSQPTIQRHALRFGAQKINLHQRGREFEPKAATALPGTADVCLLVEGGGGGGDGDGDESGGGKATDLEALARAFRDRGVEVLEGGGVVSRTGARGELRSVYVRDPDGNLIE